MAIFNSYVKLPEGKLRKSVDVTLWNMNTEQRPGEWSANGTCFPESVYMLYPLVN